jgi:5'-methylthioadenosine phosphorylase
MIIANLTQNAKTAQQIFAGAVDKLPYARTCECATALKFALITRPEVVPPKTRKELAPLVAKYLA